MLREGLLAGVEPRVMMTGGLLLGGGEESLVGLVLTCDYDDDGYGAGSFFFLS